MENSFNVKRKIKAAGAIVLLSVISLAGYYILQPDYNHYKAAPISGKVVDKETGKPVEGVHVAVYWQLYDNSLLGGLGGRVATDVIGVSETITDKDGYYHIPGWEKDVGDENYLGEESPMIGFYKTGYKFKQVYNSNMTLLVNKDYISEGYEYSKKKTEDGDIYLSTWDGVVVKIDKEGDDFAKRKYNLENTYRFVDQVLSGKGCESEHIIKFILAYSENAEGLKKIIKNKYPEKQRYIKFYSIEDLGDMHCAPVKEILK
jgi:hypothetical protein